VKNHYHDDDATDLQLVLTAKSEVNNKQIKFSPQQKVAPRRLPFPNRPPPSSSPHLASDI
jgi:hypothetical protein